MKKIRIIMTGIIFSVLIMAVAGGIWYWNANKKRIIRAELERAISQKSKGLYQVHYDSLVLDEVNGYMSLSSFTLNYDSLKYERLKKDNKEPFAVFRISIPKMLIAGVATPRALIDNEIRGRHLTLFNPVIEILYTKGGKDSSRNVPDKAIYEQILGSLDLIKLDSVVIIGAEITTKDFKTGKTFVHFQNVSISMLNVAVDSISNADSTRLLLAREINFDCEKFTWKSSNQLYNYQVDSLALRSGASNISIKNFFIQPVLNEDEFVRKFSFQTDRFDFAVHNIQLRNVNYYQLVNEKITADSLLIGSASFKIYRDRNMPADNKNRVGSYPHQLIQNMPIQLDIKKGVVRNGYIEYKEKSPITHQSGKVQFSNAYLTVSNITNIKESIANNNQMVFDVQCRFLNKVPLHSTWTSYLGNADGRFAIRGRMSAADASIFNVVAQPMGPALFKTGYVSSMDFDLAGTNHKMKGTLKLLYDDLHVSLLKKDEDAPGQFKKKRLINFFANMKIKNDNPGDKDGAPRVATIDFQRDTHRSIFNFAWKSLFEGIKEVTGAK